MLPVDAQVPHAVDQCNDRATVTVADIARQTGELQGGLERGFFALVDMFA